MDDDDEVPRQSLGRRYESREARENVTEEIYQQYKHETDAEVERKRGVIRKFLMTDFDVNYNEARMAGLNRVVHERQRAKMRRERLAEWTAWGKLLGTFGGGVVVGLGVALPL